MENRVEELKNQSMSKALVIGKLVNQDHGINHVQQ